MTLLDPPYRCPHCGKVIQEIKDQAGKTIRVRKGWTKTAERNRLIRERYQGLRDENRPSMVSLKITAHEFCLSESAVEKIVYAEETDCSNPNPQ